MPKKRFKITPAVYLVLTKNNNILLLRRFNTGYEDGKYSLVAGHLDGNETFKQAMAREAKEEAGIILNPNNLEIVHVMHRKSNDERMDIFLTIDKWGGEPKNMEPHKCDDLSWFDLNNLPENTIPFIKQVIKNIQNKIIYSEFGFN